jgi:hypothetical protein
MRSRRNNLALTSALLLLGAAGGCADAAKTGAAKAPAQTVEQRAQMMRGNPSLPPQAREAAARAIRSQSR